jgi:hypothetical protein
MGLVIGGITLGSVFSPIEQAPNQVAFNGKIYRGTHDGKILESAPEVLVWSVKTNFGQECSVKSMSVMENNLQVRLDFHGLPIYLQSHDGQIWYTDGYQAPA